MNGALWGCVVGLSVVFMCSFAIDAWMIREILRRLESVEADCGNLTNDLRKFRAQLEEVEDCIKLISNQLSVFEQQYRSDHADKECPVPAPRVPGLPSPAPKPRRKS